MLYPRRVGTRGQLQGAQAPEFKYVGGTLPLHFGLCYLTLALVEKAGTDRLDTAH